MSRAASRREASLPVAASVAHVGARSAWRWVAVIVGLWCALTLIAVVGARWYGRARLEAALARVRASGAPVLPLEIRPLRPAQGEDARAWLAQFAAQTQDAGQLDLRFRGGITGILGTAMLAAPRLTRVAALCAPEPELADLQALGECTELLEAHGNDIDAFWKSLDEELYRAELRSDRLDCYGAALRVRAQRLGPDVLEQALAACRCAPVDASALLAELDQQPRAMPEFAACSGALEATRILADLARAETLAGDGPAALRALEAGLCAANSIADVPWIAAHLTWQFCLRTVLSAVEFALLHLDGDADFSRIDALLAPVAPRELGLRALQGERALVNRAYARIAAGLPIGQDDVDHQPFFTRWMLAIGLALEQAEYLADFEHLLSDFESSAPVRWSGAPAPTSSSFGVPWVQDSLRSAAGLRVGCAEVQARIDLLRVALVARAQGLDAARRACDERRDLFDGQPLRLRVEESGLVVLWSTGPDGTDDAGEWPPSDKSPGVYDVVTRVRVR